MNPSDASGITSAGQSLTLCRIGPAHADGLRQFFEAFSADAEASAMFHPHPFTAERAQTIAHYPGADYYAAMLRGPVVVSYGMLRGWDEGYDIPSLGIVVGASHRGLGLGRLMMEYLHAVARTRGATAIMLKVYKRNETAARLYRRLGYELVDLNEREWKGSCRL